MNEQEICKLVPDVPTWKKVIPAPSIYTFAFILGWAGAELGEGGLYPEGNDAPNEVEPVLLILNEP